MDIVQMENVLHNLTNLESFFKETVRGSDYLDTETYERLLDQNFIKSRHLESVYWPQPDFYVEMPKKVSVYSNLGEQLLFLHGNITMMKQMNLPFDHVLVNDFFQCIYVMEGNADMRIGNKKIQLDEGDFFVLYPGVEHILNSAGDAIVINILVKKRHLLSDKFQMIEGQYYFLGRGSNTFRLEDTEYMLFHTSENEEIRPVVLRMFTEYLEKSACWEVVMDGYLTLLFAYLLRYKSGEIEFSFQPDRAQQIFEQIFQYCGTNIGHVSLALAAEQLHFSKQYIGRIVKEQTGSTFSAMIQELKLEQVKKYLDNTGLTLEVIAEICGFTDAAHLSKVFKKKEQMSPSEYRRRRREKEH